jgi:hypothetical protein
MLDGGRESFSSYKRAVAICNVLTAIGMEDLQTEEDRRSYIQSHIRDFEWLSSATKTSKLHLSTAPIRGAVLLHKEAGVPGSKLAHFWDVLQTGFSECTEDRTIVRLRDWIIGYGKDSRTTQYRQEVLCTVYGVMNKWLNGQIVRTVAPTTELPVLAG